MILPKGSVLAGVRAEAPVAPSSIAKKPAAAVVRGAAGGVNETCDFGGEALPESGAGSCRAVAKNPVGNVEMKRHTGQVLSDVAA